MTAAALPFEKFLWPKGAAQPLEWLSIPTDAAQRWSLLLSHCAAPSEALLVRLHAAFGGAVALIGTPLREAPVLQISSILAPPPALWRPALRGRVPVYAAAAAGHEAAFARIEAVGGISIAASGAAGGAKWRTEDTLAFHAWLSALCKETDA